MGNGALGTGKMEGWLRDGDSNCHQTSPRDLPGERHFHLYSLPFSSTSFPLNQMPSPPNVHLGDVFKPWQLLPALGPTSPGA